jgi:hypothetical protein
VCVGVGVGAGADVDVDVDEIEGVEEAVDMIEGG